MAQVETYEQRLMRARSFDAGDELAAFRDEFHLPKQDNGEPVLYFVGNSLGLQPKRTESYIAEELTKWRELGVRGHFECERPWMPYHEFLTETMAELVGAQANEVVMMNSLTTNLHLMLATFYRPTPARHKILIEDHAFPSDFQTASSQIEWNGFAPENSLLVLPTDGASVTINEEAILETIHREGSQLALVMLPGVQYYTGQVFPMERIVAAAHAVGAKVGFDLAHAAGNIRLNLHDWDVDFAVWCSYKYLNSGPGSVGGCFVHERHASNVDLPRLAGWWGHDKGTRFKMKNEFKAIPTAEGWQLSNPPILSLAAIRAALDVFKEAGGMSPLIGKSTLLTQYLDVQLRQRLGDRIKVLTPESSRGCQLSLEIDCGDLPGKQVHRHLEASGVETDWREPNVIRVAPVPLYNSFEDCFHFVEKLANCMKP
ncbi:MAG: kynureninase [Pirellulaceae bacterium]|nr:kynureninase [Pirellulaceae bacterium]